MLVEKPPALQHGGAPIFSLHISPCGKRLATAGGDQKVRPPSTPRAPEGRPGGASTASLLLGRGGPRLTREGLPRRSGSWSWAS